MEELLTRLYDRLCMTFLEKLSAKDICYFTDTKEINTFQTLMTLNKTEKVLNEIMLYEAISYDELKFEFDDNDLKECFKNSYIIKGSHINSNKVFIGANGMFKLYSLKEYNLEEVFIAFDSNKFGIKDYKLKTSEKIWCIFLLLKGADNVNNSFNSEGLSLKKLEDYHKFFISIENNFKNNGIILGKEISWESGKDINFRKFITNNVDLPKTGLYFYSGYKYYLDLSKRRNAKYLIDLILAPLTGGNRLLANGIFYKTLADLKFNISMELGELPGTINHFIVEELNSSS